MRNMKRVQIRYSPQSRGEEKEKAFVFLLTTNSSSNSPIPYDVYNDCCVFNYSFFDKSETAVNFLLENGIDKVSLCCKFIYSYKGKGTRAFIFC